MPIELQNRESAFLAPRRGVVVSHTRDGAVLDAPTLERWLRLCCVVYKAEKVDVLIAGSDLAPVLALRGAAKELQVALSLRTDCAVPPPSSESLRNAGLWDVFLCPTNPYNLHVELWLRACEETGLMVRLQVQGPYTAKLDAEALVGRLVRPPVCVFDVAAWNSMTSESAEADPVDGSPAIAAMNALVRVAAKRNVEVNLVGLPFCHVEEANRVYAANNRQLDSDHHHYEPRSYNLARELFRRKPNQIRQIILSLLGQHTSTDNPIDRALFPWVWHKPWIRARIWAAHKLLRNRPRNGKKERESPEAIIEADAWRRYPTGRPCRECSLNRICDGVTKELLEVMRDVKPVTQTGEAVLDPFHFAASQPKYFDALDATRLEGSKRLRALADAANRLLETVPPDKEIDSFSYAVEGTWSFPAQGSLRWFSFAVSDKVSTPLGRFETPVTISAVFGGGIAEYIGFGLGSACRLLCPMTAYSHRVVLHIEEDGQYVLLRDGLPMQPVEFTGRYYAPARLNGIIEPRIAMVNIDGTIATQAVNVWSKKPEQPASTTKNRFSIVTVSTRYSRRLQAALQSIVHQEGIDLAEVEVIVSYVPGFDATGDVLDAMKSAHPELTIIPNPFTAEFATAKGLMLNDSFRKARGEWVMVLDADILLPPPVLAEIGKLPEICKFAIPDGRKMLSRETTAKVLLGEIEPWNEWKALMEGAGEYRITEVDGVPIGYCQCVRRECLNKVQYEEANHFEGADWRFGKEMRQFFGDETRLTGIPVLHLDHGSSNWYGASRHY